MTEKRTVIVVCIEGDHEATMFNGVFDDLETATAAFGYSVTDLIPHKRDENEWAMGWRTLYRFTLNSGGNPDSKRNDEAEERAQRPVKSGYSVIGTFGPNYGKRPE